MIKGGKGGGKTTTGLNFEKKVDFLTLLTQIQGYTTKNHVSAGVEILFKGDIVARCFKKHEFYKYLASEGVDWNKLLSKRLLPDDAILVTLSKTLFILEVKYQQGAGSVDEKLQTCDFKRKQYMKLVSPLGLKVEYVYILNDWFKQSGYNDVLDYIHSVNCHYKFKELPLTWLGLPN